MRRGRFCPGLLARRRPPVQPSSGHTSLFIFVTKLRKYHLLRLLLLTSIRPLESRNPDAAWPQPPSCNSCPVIAISYHMRLEPPQCLLGHFSQRYFSVSRPLTCLPHASDCARFLHTPSPRVKRAVANRILCCLVFSPMPPCYPTRPPVSDIILKRIAESWEEKVTIMWSSDMHLPRSTSATCMPRFDLTRAHLLLHAPHPHNLRPPHPSPHMSCLRSDPCTSLQSWWLQLCFEGAVHPARIPFRLILPLRPDQFIFMLVLQLPMCSQQCEHHRLFSACGFLVHCRAPNSTAQSASVVSRFRCFWLRPLQYVVKALVVILRSLSSSDLLRSPLVETHF